MADEHILMIPSHYHLPTPIRASMQRSIIHRGMVAALARAFAALLLLRPWQLVGAAEYLVGDVAFGWDSGVNYAAWARDHAFAIGDVLVFQYVSSKHNVYTGGGNGVRVRYTTGYDRVVLAEVRSYWFICDFPGHCLGGMKVAVNVSTAAGSPSPPLQPGGSNAASPAAGEGRRSWLAWGLGLGVVLSM